MIPQGVLHTLAGGVSLSHGALQDTFIPIQPGRLGISGFQSWKEVFSLPFSGLLPSWRKPSFSFGLMLSCLEEVPVCLLLPCYV